MRTIKFRGKSLAYGEWVYGDLQTSHREGKCIIHWYNKDIDRYVHEEVDPATVGQFTGLHDKNGKEIYEGDIVRFYSSGSRCINPDCDAFNLIYESFVKKVEDAVSYEDGMFSCDCSPLAYCGFSDLDDIRHYLGVSEEDGWGDVDGNIIDEHILGIKIVGNIYDNS